MENRGRINGVDCEKQIREAEARLEQVEERLKKARTRTELAETRTELAEARTELAEARAALAETRAEQVENTLHRVIQNQPELSNGRDQPDSGESLSNGTPNPGRPLEQLTHRQRDILQHIAEGQNTKQIAHTMHLSPKTVEYHRTKLMRVLGVHDIPGLVRLAIRAGLVPAES